MSSAADLQRARSLVELRRWPEAVTALGPVLADPHSGAEPWCLLAQCQLARAEHAEAARSARRAVAADPQDPWAHRLHAIALLARGRTRQSLRACQESLRLRPGEANALHVLAMVRLAQRRRAAAQQAAAHNVEQNPFHSIAWQSAARVAQTRRNWVAAEQYARRGLSLDPHDAELAMVLGRSLDKQGRRAEAGEAYAAAARSDPTDHGPRRALGRLGVPAVGLGLVGFKLLPLLLWWGARVAVGLLVLPTALVAAAFAVLVGGWYGVTEVLFRRASGQLSPPLRVIARRQRRQDSRVWSAVTVLLAAVLAVRAGFGQEWLLTGVLVAVAAAAVWARRAVPAPLPAPAPPRRTGWAARGLYSILSRLR